MNHSRSMRMEMAELVLHNPGLVRPLLEIGFQNSDPVSPRACWVLEFTARQNLRYLDPHLDLWATRLSVLSHESSIRPMAKICELLVLEYYGRSGNKGPSCLAPQHLELIATACFDWLIGPHKVAPKAYSMTSLYHLGKDFDWIHAELQLLLENEYSSGSAAFKARARQILSKLRKH
ncbi:MAG: adenylosuccinate lyase [Flavobacteriaceae bacterium]